MYSKYVCYDKNSFPPEPKSWHNGTTGKKVPAAHAQLSLLPTWKFDNVMKTFMGRASWELVYTDGWTERQMDAIKLFSLSESLLVVARVAM